MFIVISKLTADEISKYRDFVIQRRDKLVAYYSNMLVTNRDIEKDKQEHGLTRARSTTDAEKHRRLRLPGADSLRPQSMKIARPTVEVVQKDIVMHEKMHLAALNADVNVPHVSTPDFAPLDAMEEKTFYRYHLQPLAVVERCPHHQQGFSMRKRRREALSPTKPSSSRFRKG